MVWQKNEVHIVVDNIVAVVCNIILHKMKKHASITRFMYLYVHVCLYVHDMALLDAISCQILPQMDVLYMRF